MQESSAWRIIDSIMSMVALGAFAGVLLIAAITLFGTGFHIYNLSYHWAAIGAWIGSGIILLASLVLMRLFRKAYRIQKAKEGDEDYTRRTGKLT